MTGRRPVWSQVVTTPLAAAIPVRRRPGAVRAIKAVHTAIFVSIGGLILLFAWDGIRGRPRRRAAIAAGLALTETAVFVSNNLVCPLTPLAEQLGSASGSVTDIYLPDWLSRRIPLVSGSVLVLGLVLNGRAVRRDRRLGEPSRYPSV
jgi:hypothetical protein